MAYMSTDLTWQTVSTSSESTMRLAAQIGRRLKGGEVIELVSDLGGGKTTFVRGLAAGMGSPDKVASPSFTIMREYRAGQETLYHFDFYRLADAGLTGNELIEALQDPAGIVVVEWAEVVEDVLPAERLVITISATGEETRQLLFRYPESKSYLLSNLTS